MSEQKEIIVGGQAVIEGVMMRAPNSWAVAVRRPDGTIVSQAEALPSLSLKYPILKVPVLRGSAVLIHSMVLGVRALNFSANIALAEEDSTAAGKSPAQSAGAAGSIVMALFFNILLFVVLPLLLTNALFLYLGTEQPHLVDWREGPWYEAGWNWLRAWVKPVRPSISFNLVDGLIRMGLFLLMIWSFSKLDDIRRIFEYHGAEHKTVFTWEAGEELTVANARRHPRQHPRCGTSFLMVVMLVSILLFSIVKFDSLLLNLLTRIALVPVIAGISYEIIKAAGQRETSPIFRLMTLPGIWLQNVTTREPSNDQLEVAIYALRESLKLEPATAPCGVATRVVAAD